MIYIVLPAFNEEEAIGSLLESIDELIGETREAYEVIVVDDGSSDRTAEVVESFQSRIPIDLISHHANKGLGEAIKAGLLKAARTCTDKDIIVTMDADNTHAPGLIRRMVRNLKEGNDVVVASRYREGSRIKGVTLSRRVLSRGANILVSGLFRIKGVRDYTCGYRAYRANVLKRAFRDHGDSLVSQSGFSCMVDILLKLRRYDIIVNEVPLVLRYDLKRGRTKMDVRANVLETLRLIGSNLLTRRNNNRSGVREHEANN